MRFRFFDSSIIRSDKSTFAALVLTSVDSYSRAKPYQSGALSFGKEVLLIRCLLSLLQRKLHCEWIRGVPVCAYKKSELFLVVTKSKIQVSPVSPVATSAGGGSNLHLRIMRKSSSSLILQFQARLIQVSHNTKNFSFPSTNRNRAYFWPKRVYSEFRLCS